MKNQSPAKTPHHRPSPIGRNERCWCGSGKKFKHCHQREEQAWQAEQLRLSAAHDQLVPKILEAARAHSLSVVAALDRFWNGKYRAAHLAELDELEPRGAERFLTWFAFDYVQENGLTLVETMAHAAMGDAFDGDAYEARLLHDWQGVRLSPYCVEHIIPGRGVLMRHLLTQAIAEVKDHQASRRLAPGEIIVGHLLPLGTSDYRPSSPPRFVIGGAAAQLTADTQEPILALASRTLAEIQQHHANAGWTDLIRLRSEIFNHVIMELGTDREHHR